MNIHNLDPRLSNLDNPLTELIEEDRQQELKGDLVLKELIKPYAYISQRTLQFKLREEAEQIPKQLVVLIVFLVYLAMKRMAIITEASISQKQLIELLDEYGIAAGTIKSALKHWREKNILTKAGEGRYETTFDKLNRIQREFNVVIKPTEHGT